MNGRRFPSRPPSHRRDLRLCLYEYRLTDGIRARIDELFGQDRELPEILEDVARLGAQLLMQAALETEVTEFLGRDRRSDGEPE